MNRTWQEECGAPRTPGSVEETHKGQLFNISWDGSGPYAGFHCIWLGGVRSVRILDKSCRSCKAKCVPSEGLAEVCVFGGRVGNLLEEK